VWKFFNSLDFDSFLALYTDAKGSFGRDIWSAFGDSLSFSIVRKAVVPSSLTPSPSPTVSFLVPIVVYGALTLWRCAEILRFIARKGEREREEERGRTERRGERQK
jgi:hypothetical protein